MPSDLEAWTAYLKEAEDAFDVATEAERQLGGFDYAIAYLLPAAREKTKRAKARYQERLTAFIAWRENGVRQNARR